MIAPINMASSTGPAPPFPAQDPAADPSAPSFPPHTTTGTGPAAAGGEEGGADAGAGSSSPLSRQSTPLSDADDPDAEGEDEDREGEEDEEEDEASGPRGLDGAVDGDGDADGSDDEATSSTVPLSPPPDDEGEAGADMDADGGPMQLDAGDRERDRSESISDPEDAEDPQDEDCEGEDENENEDAGEDEDDPLDDPEVGAPPRRAGEDDDDGSELTPEGSDEEDAEADADADAAQRGRGMNGRVPETGAGEDEEEDEDEDDDTQGVEGGAGRRLAENGSGSRDAKGVLADADTAGGYDSENESAADGEEGEADADGDEDDADDADDADVTITGPTGLNGASAQLNADADQESTARRPSNGRITAPAERPLANKTARSAVEDSDDELSELEEEDAGGEAEAQGEGGGEAGTTGLGRDGVQGEGEEDEESLAREASPSKSSAETPPPSAQPHAPTYHLRGDPYHQVTAVPTAPTAEALASFLEIELKFARLRDGLYVERMTELTAEEMMIVQGDHPAIQFLHGVLESRKNKLLEYAELRVKQAEAELNREMKAHRKVVLFTWADNREKLCDEYYEANTRKKRKIEKDRVELDAHRPSLPVNPKPVPAKDPAVAERIMRGFDWSRGPVVSGGLSAAMVNEDLARIGIRRPAMMYNGVAGPPHQFGMAPQPAVMHGGSYIDPATGRVTMAGVPPPYPMVQDEAPGGSGGDGPNGAYEHGARVNGHHHHHHHHPSGNVPAPSGAGGSGGAQSSHASHGGRPILGRPRYGHAATGVHLSAPSASSSNGPVREGRTVPTSSQDPFDPNRRRPRERDEWPAKREHGISVEVDDAKRKREGSALSNGAPSRSMYGAYGGEMGYSGGGGGLPGSRSVLDAKAAVEHSRHQEAGRSKESSAPNGSSGGLAPGSAYSSTYANGPLSGLGGGAPPRSNGWSFGMYGSGMGGAAGGGVGGSSATNGARATEPIGGRNIMAR